MPAAQYPFIDIAVHPAVRDQLARGSALVLFAPDMASVLWANGTGAAFFGTPLIYEFLENGPNRNDLSFRQLAVTAGQITAVGDTRSLVVRVPSGFQRVAVQAQVEMIEIRRGEPAILFSLPPGESAQSPLQLSRRLLSGFDDPDTHMAVLDNQGMVISASEGFARLDITDQTARGFVTMVDSERSRLLKRPIQTRLGYLPAAIGKISEEPSLNLLFVVETILGNFGPSDEALETEVRAAPQPDTAVADAAPEVPSDAPFAAKPEAVEPDEEDKTDDVAAFAEDDSSQPPADDQRLEPATSFDADDGDDRDTDTGSDTIEPGPDDIDSSENEIAPQANLDTFSTDADAQMVNAAQPASSLIDTVVDMMSADEDNAAQEQDPVADAPATAAEPDDAEPEAAKAEQAIEAEAAGDVPAFVFDPKSRATRFVWKIDAEGRFSEVSHEFAEAVGPRAAAINGVSFADLAERLDLDPEGTVRALLNKRDTWSGKTILWPIEGTALRVPVDLAALPTYTRNRDFDGFRGFGVVRISDAVDDADGAGLTLAGNAAPDTVAAEETDSIVEAETEAKTSVSDNAPPTEASAAAATDEMPAANQPAANQPAANQPAANQNVEDAAVNAEEVPDATAAQTETDVEVEAEPDTDTAPAADAPDAGIVRDEPPVLTLAETPNRRQSDKVIRFQDHRVRNRDGLSPGEEAAFREIARKLDPHGLRDPASASRTQAPAEQTEDDVMTGDQSAEAATEHSDIPAQTPTVDERRDTATTEAPSDAVDAPADEADRSDEDHDEIIQAPDEQDEHTRSFSVFASTVNRKEVGFSAELVDAMPVALLVHVGDRLIHANPEFLKLSGYDSVEALGKAGGLDVLLQRQDLEGASETASRIVAVRSDDELVPVSARLQSIRWDGASALMLSLVPVETTIPASDLARPDAANQDLGRQDMASELARVQVEVDEMRSILETATDGVVILSSEGEIRSMNGSAGALFNYEDAEVRGKPFVMLFAHESQKAILDYLSGLAGHGVASVLNDGREVIGREASGGFLPLFMTIGRLTSSNGYCAVIRDITQWKRTEEELRNAKRAAETANSHKSDFLARVSHEIRTPLNAIIGFADMMANEHFGPIGHTRYSEYATDIVRSGRHVLDIVNDLLDISKIEAGEMDLDFTAVGLNETVSQAVSIVQPQANGQRVIIRTSLSQTVPSVVADMRSIKQIVLNVLANAIRFTPSGGQIIVSTAYEMNGSVSLRIRDTGIGMSRSELEQAMKPFRQISSGMQARGDGTGLGLPLTKAMVDANRAQFSIHSTPNEGTLVEITFPSPRVLAD